MEIGPAPVAHMVYSTITSASIDHVGSQLSFTESDRGTAPPTDVSQWKRPGVDTITNIGEVVN